MTTPVEKIKAQLMGRSFGYPHLLFAVIVSAMIGAGLLAVIWLIGSPGSYDECMLEQMRGQSTEAASFNAHNVCRKRYPKG